MDPLTSLLLRNTLRNSVQRRRNHRRTIQTTMKMVSEPDFRVAVTDEKIYLSLDVPGINGKDLLVSLDNNILVIQGTRRMIVAGGTRVFEFSKNFSLNERVDTGTLTANLSNGVLVVCASKREKPSPRVISVTENPHEEAVHQDNVVVIDAESTVSKTDKTEKSNESILESATMQVKTIHQDGTSDGKPKNGDQDQS